LNDVIGIAEIATKVISKTPIVGPLLVPVNLLLKPAEDATKPAEKLGDKLDNALDNLDDWVFKPLKTIVGATDDALSSLVSTFSITGTIYQDAIECLESSEVRRAKRSEQSCEGCDVCVALRGATTREEPRFHGHRLNQIVSRMLFATYCSRRIVRTHCSPRIVRRTVRHL